MPGKGISTMRRPRSHFDGDWISKPSESEGTAYGHWPVSSQLPALATEPDIQRLSRRWSMMAQPWRFSEASDPSLSIWVLLCPAEMLRDSYCCCVCLILSLQADRYRDYWFLHKSSAAWECCHQTRVTWTGACHGCIVFFNQICRSTYIPLIVWLLLPVYMSCPQSVRVKKIE